MRRFTVVGTFPDGFKIEVASEGLTVGLAASLGYSRISQQCPPHRKMLEMISIHTDEAGVEAEGDPVLDGDLEQVPERTASERTASERTASERTASERTDPREQEAVNKAFAT